MKQPDSTRKDRRPTYIYLSSRGHSGSTFLSMLLARHPRITAVGELANLSLQVARDEKARWIGRCSCGERPFECSAWGPVLREIGAEAGIDLESDPFGWRISDIGMEEEYRRSPLASTPLDWLRNRSWRLLRYGQYTWPRSFGTVFGWYKPQQEWGRNRSVLASKIARACNVDAIVDASKDPLDMLDIYGNATLPVKIIYLTRDSRGNVWSMLKALRAGQTRSSRVIAAANEWANVNGRIWNLVQGVPAPDWLHVKYEDICSRPAIELNRIFEFVGLQPVDVTATIRDAPDVSHYGHTIGGNRVRFTSGTMVIREDRSWRDNLNPEELSVIERITGPLARKLGYEL